VTGATARVESAEPLGPAERLPATEALFREQLGRLGGTAYRLRSLTARIDGSPLAPKSLLNGLRRALVERLDASAAEPPVRRVAEASVLHELTKGLREARRAEGARPRPEPELTALCRTTEQLEAAVAAGVRTVYADYQDVTRYSDAVASARRAGAAIYLATPRIEKPFEANLFRVVAKPQPHGLLVRNAGGLAFCAERGIPFVADFSLNAANELTVDLLKARGARWATASYDLNIDQLFDLLDATPADWLEVVVHQRMPMFHMEFCAFSAHLSNGKPHPDCGRPCDHHDVKLRDRAGVEHPLKADVGCRNTLFNATPQTAAEYLPRLLAHGARRFRIEFLDDAPGAVESIVALYRDGLAGRRDAKTLWRDLKAAGKYGVTRGPLNVL
jgi:putative protease